MICQAQSKTENHVKRVAVYSDYLALQCGLIGYTIDTINGRHEKSCLPFLCLQLKFAAFGFVMRFIRVLKTAGAEKYRPAVNMTFYNSALYIKASQTGSV